MEEPHYIYVQFEDGTFGRLPSMHEADKVYDYYERKQVRQREDIRSYWVVRPNDHQVVPGKAPANWSPNSLAYLDPFARTNEERESQRASGAHEFS
jgi:hypothetical protein